MHTSEAVTEVTQFMMKAGHNRVQYFVLDPHTLLLNDFKETILLVENLLRVYVRPRPWTLTKHLNYSQRFSAQFSFQPLGSAAAILENGSFMTWINWVRDY